MSLGLGKMIGGIALAALLPDLAWSAPECGGVSLVPPRVQIGEPTLYRGWMTFPRGQRGLRWSPAPTLPNLTWSKLAASVRFGRPITGSDGRRVPPLDTLVVEARLSAFATGVIEIPGLVVQTETPTRAVVCALPAARLTVTSVLAAADSNPELRPLRGPMAAPWWERVPWRWVAAGLALAALVAWVVVRLRRRRLVSPAAPAPAFDPSATALAELAALRRLDLPRAGRWADHAFHLTRIARRFLEATAGGAHPGDTTVELIAHLEDSSVHPDDLVVLAGLMRTWDRVKFARASSTTEEATRAEAAVEAMVKRRAWASLERVA